VVQRAVKHRPSDARRAVTADDLGVKLWLRLRERMRQRALRRRALRNKRLMDRASRAERYGP